MGTSTTTGNSGLKPGVVSRFQSIADTPGEPSGFMADGSVMDAFNLLGWVEENSAHFKPPVGNKYLYSGRDFFVMVIKGPNARNDFHQVDSEEFFIQLKGDVAVKTIEDGVVKVHAIREGEVFFIPPNVPHRFRNRSETEPMKILWIYASVNATRTLTDTGETRPVAAEHNR